MDAATLRQNFPEFANTTTYPDTLVNFWLSVGVKLLRPCAWVDLLEEGLQLFTAHNLVLAARNAKAATAGGLPGAGVGGPLASKQVDKVSMSYDTGAATIEGAGAYNLTSYGIMFEQLANMVGTGGLQISGAGPGPQFAPLGTWQ